MDPSSPLFCSNGSAYISTSTEKPSAAAASAPVTITSSSKISNNPNNTSDAADAAEAARFEPYCTLLKPQRPTVLSPGAKEPQNIPLRPQLGPSSLLAPPPPTPQQQHPHHHHQSPPDPSAHVVSLQIDCYPELQPPPGAVLSGLSPGSLGYLNSFPSAAAGAFDNNDSPSRRNGHPPSQQQPSLQPSLQYQQSRGLPGAPVPPRQWATEVLVQKQQNQQRLVAAPRQLQMQMQMHHPQQQQQQQQPPSAAAPRAPSHHMSKSSSGPWAEEAAQIAKAQLANSTSGLVEEKKPQPALVKPSDPGQRPVLKIQPRTRPVEIPSAPPATPTASAAAAPPPPQGAYSKSPPSSSSSKSLSSSQSSHSSSEAPEPPATKPPGAAARPKLNLKPRSKPLEEDPASGGPGGRRSSPFGGALPREVILNKRGEPVRPGDDPFDAPPASVSSVKGTAARPDSQSGWHTVHHRKSGGGGAPPSAAGGGAVGGGGALSDDPFFGDYAPPGRSLSALVRSFEQQPQNGLGGFRPLGGAFSTPSNCSTEADANPFTKRGLPMRSDDYF